MSGAGSWLRRFTDAAAAPRARVVCLPHAGGAASAYQGWARRMPPGTELLAVQYPGRQERLDDPCSRSMEETADAVSTALAALAPLPTVVFGHSMGSLVAYETVRRLELRAPEAVPVRLFVSGTAAPHRDREDLPGPDDDALVAYTRRQGDAGRGDSAQDDVYAVPELRALLLPSLRADFHLLRSYRPARPPVRLGVPLTAFGGDRDAGCPPDALATWADLTAGELTTRVFPGGHFYLREHEELVAALVASACPVSAVRPVSAAAP
ncbi:thioesterase II family protein [Streptomyces sp. NPDC091268]|uniref:thioesterase II family protein n=1 Tax=Streptomyces sp. NPDC091268 TaxID=3365979 RepID=UPI00380AC2F8